MKRKKELIIISIIVFVSILLVLLPSIISCTKKQSVFIIEDTTKESNYINITIKGELNIPQESDIYIGSYTNSKTFEFEKGISYRKISDIVYSLYRTKYTIIDTSMYNIKYYTDTTITFYSSYVSSSDTLELTTVIDNSDKININTATKEELMTLYGIGDARSTLIISYREGKEIESFDELKSLLGVSDEVIEYIKEKAIL